MANGFPLPPGVPLGAGSLGAPPGLGPPGIPPGLAPPEGPSGPISALAAREAPNALDKIRRAVDLLEEAREMDPKVGNVVSMAMHVLRNGQKGIEDFKQDSEGGLRGVSV